MSTNKFIQFTANTCLKMFILATCSVIPHHGWRDALLYFTLQTNFLATLLLKIDIVLLNSF